MFVKTIKSGIVVNTKYIIYIMPYADNCFLIEVEGLHKPDFITQEEYEKIIGEKNEN